MMNLKHARALAFLGSALLIQACEAHPDANPVHGEEIVYTAGDTELTGYLAYPTDRDGAPKQGLPAVLVVHEWWGHNEYVRTRADQLARLGYAAFALDMYGTGKVAEHPSDAGAFMEELMTNQEALSARFDAAYDLLTQRSFVDPTKTAAIGYCMGGSIALNMARVGKDLDAVVSFHGSLGMGFEAEKGSVDTKILILNGAADPIVPESELDAFEQGLLAAGVDYEIKSYEGVKHGFTNPMATKKAAEFEALSQALGYDAKADADSWRRMRSLLDSVF